MIRTLWRSSLAACVLAVTTVLPAADIKRAIPSESFLFAYQRQNPERDYQKKYYADVWKTVQETQIIDRVVGIITSNMDQSDVDQATAVLKQIKEAAEPIDLDALMNASESVYGQMMVVENFPTSQHLFVCRVTTEAASGTVEGMGNLFDMAAEAAGGVLTVDRSKVGEATVVSLIIPPPAPFQLTVVAQGDVVLFASSQALAMQGLELMNSADAECKFDDERLQAGLKKMPEAEDGLTFYDARMQFAQLDGIVEFIRQSGGAEGAMIADVLADVLAQMAIPDYELTVEYTDGNRNLSMTHGKLLPDVEDLAGYKMFGSGEPFKDWSKWIPADATAYSMGTGVNLHALYTWAIPYAREKFPQVQQGLDQFEAAQEAFGVHLDKDILQAFSGEYVSVSMPSAAASLMGPGGESAMFLRCQKPERMQELLDRLFNFVLQIPQVQQQQLKITESKDLEGFDEISAMALQMVGVRPVIGFHDGWMVIGSSSGAVKKVLATQAGEADSIAGTDAFKAFGVEIDGPVTSVAYQNLAQNTRNAAMMVGQMGTMLPGLMAMAGAQANGDEMKPVMEVLGLLPSVAKVIAKFDFLEAQLTVTQAGDEPGTYVRRSVILVRPESSN